MVAGVLADKQQSTVLVQDSYERVGNTLETVRARFERRLDSSIHALHELAGKLGSSEGFGQTGFEALAEDALRSHPEAILAELSPGFITAFVYPLEGNRSRIGRDLRSAPGVAGGVPRMRSQLSAFLYGPVRLEDGTRALGLQLPLLNTNDAPTSLAGAISMFLGVEEILRQSGIPDPEGEIQYLVLFENGTGGSQNVLQGSFDVMEDSPVSSEISLPNGNWTILARPTDGWHPDSDAQLAYRLFLLGLGVIILMPAAIANRFAVAREDTIRELEAARTQLAGVLHNIPGAVFTYRLPPGQLAPGPEDKIHFFNKESCKEIWGVDAAIAEEDVTTLWQLASDEAGRQGLQGEIAASAAELREWYHVWPIRTRAGAEKWLEGRGHPTRTPDGATWWYSIINDVTDEVARKAELERQKEVAYIAQKNDSLGKLTGGVAHDFNNLLAVIMGNQELLRDALNASPDPNPELLEFVENSMQASERGAGLTRKMLAFARRARLEPAVLDLNQVVRETAAWAGRTMPQSIEIQTAFDDALPKVKIDRGSAENALLNLMVNARDAMLEGGTLSIRTEAVTLQEGEPLCARAGLTPGAYVRLIVEDTGTGIPPENLPRIYEPFFSTKPAASGSGLGLSMVQGFMEQSGGAVTVDTEPGKGTRFALFFRAMEERTQPAQNQRYLAPSVPHRKMRIMLVEDQKEVRKILSSTLSAAGYELLEAETGDEAFDMFKQTPDIDLLLTDVVMPGNLQGTELAAAIRGMVPDLPVLFLSGYDSTLDHANYSSHRRDIWLTKPVDRATLIDAVECSLGRGAANPTK